MSYRKFKLASAFLLSVGVAPEALAQSCDIVDSAKSRLTSALETSIANLKAGHPCVGVTEVIAAAEAMSRIPQSCFTPDSPRVSQFAAMAARYRADQADCNRPQQPERSPQQQTIDTVIQNRGRNNTGLNDARPTPPVQQTAPTRPAAPVPPPAQPAQPAARPTPPPQAPKQAAGPLPTAQGCVQLVGSRKVSSMCDFKPGVPMYANTVTVPPGDQNCPAKVQYAYINPEDGSVQTRFAGKGGDTFHTCKAGISGVRVVP